jgi:hypothetical protein
MQKDKRDVLEVLKFDLMEETVGSWLRAIIRRLEKSRWLLETCGAISDRGLHQQGGYTREPHFASQDLPRSLTSGR